MTKSEKAELVKETRAAASAAYGVWQDSITNGESNTAVYYKRVEWEFANDKFKDALDERAY